MSGARRVTYGPDPVTTTVRGDGWEIRLKVAPDLASKWAGNLATAAAAMASTLPDVSVVIDQAATDLEEAVPKKKAPRRRGKKA